MLGRFPSRGVVFAAANGLRAARVEYDVVAALGYGTGERRRKWHSGAALGVALALGFGLMFLQVVLHGVCIESFHMCRDRGDGNMSYWFQSFFAIPIYWIVGWSTRRFA